MPSARILVIAIAAACLALVALQLLGQTLPAVGAKVVASTAYVALAIRSGALKSPYGRLVLAGLVFSWCGDMALTGLSRQAFLAGLSAFLLAHIAYIAAFVRHGYDRTWAIVAAIPLTLVAIAVWTWLEPNTPTALSVPVRAYIAVISLMLIFAIGTRGRGGSPLIVAGALMFFLSDLSVAALRLVQTDYATYAVGLPLYFAAQACFALSVSQSRSH
jgi:uncharacterized membrane protein YhhN